MLSVGIKERGRERKSGIETESEEGTMKRKRDRDRYKEITIDRRTERECERMYRKRHKQG